MPCIGTCFRFYMQMRVEKKKHLHIEFIVTSHNSVDDMLVKSTGFNVNFITHEQGHFTSLQIV